MSTFRVKKEKNPFVMIDKTSLKDERLSWKAKGLLAYLLSLPDDWKIYEAEITGHSTDGIKSTRSGIQELIKYGYIVRVQLRGEKGKFGGYEYEVYEKPTVIPKEENGENVDNATVIPKSENGETENGKSENGEAENGKGHTTNNDNTDNDNTEKEKNNILSSTEKKDKFLKSIRTEIDETPFNNFIKKLDIQESNNKIILVTPNSIVKTIVENKFLDLVKIHLKKYYDFDELDFKCEAS